MPPVGSAVSWASGSSPSVEAMSSICTETSSPTSRSSGLRMLEGVIESVEISRPLSSAISMSSAHAVLTTMSMVGICGV